MMLRKEMETQNNNKKKKIINRKITQKVTFSIDFTYIYFLYVK